MMAFHDEDSFALIDDRVRRVGAGSVLDCFTRIPVSQSGEDFSQRSAAAVVDSGAGVGPSPSDEVADASVPLCVRVRSSVTADGSEWRNTVVIVDAEAARKHTPFPRIGFRAETIAIVVESELELLRGVSEIIRAYDPDIVMGFEVQKASLGFLIARAAYVVWYVPAACLTWVWQDTELSVRAGNRAPGAAVCSFAQG